MNLQRTLLAGLAGGVAHNLVSFVLHGFVMADSYVRMDTVFSQEQASPVWFVLISVMVGLVTAVLFAKTRQMWADGPKGGMMFAVWPGLIVGFNQFFLALVVQGFPYYLVWCWLGIDLIAFVAMGIVLGAILRREG